MLVLDDPDLCDAVRRLTIDPGQSRRYRLDDVLRRNFAALATTARLRSPLHFAYSVKTNPDAAFVSAARDAGLYAEVISPQELALAREFGFGNKTIYNGPWPAWRAGASPGIAFADSLEAFAGNTRHLNDTLPGLRVRPRHIPSRFGVAPDETNDIAEVVRQSGCDALGVSFHVRPEDYGTRSWREIVEEVLDFASEIERVTRARVVSFNIGGGRTPLEFDRGVAGGDLAWLTRVTTQALPALQTLFAEPGQAVATPCMVLVTPVLEHRKNEIVVASGYPEVSQIRTYAHRVLAVFDDGSIELMETGYDRILGRTCLEYDIIRDNIGLPRRAERLIAIVIADVGAYDFSMAFEFAGGGNKERDDFGVHRR